MDKINNEANNVHESADEKKVDEIKVEAEQNVNGLFETLKKISFWGIIFIGLYLIINNFPLFTPNIIDPKTGLLLVFFIGFLTSFHCIGMCSGMIIAYTSNNPDKGIKPHACYNAGRVVSYTLLGALLGFFGSVIAITDQVRGFIAFIAGIFLFLYGLSLFYPKLRKYITLPSIYNSNNKIVKNPTLLGLLNGFMPCGPLQALLIYAAGTGDWMQGGLTMLAFSLGTVPLMFLAGTALSRFSIKWSGRAVKFASVLMIVLGLIMLQRSSLLLGLQIPLINEFSNSVLTDQSQQQGLNQLTQFKDGYQTIYMNITRYGWEPSTLVVVKGIPVKWVVTAKELNYCNKGIKVPQLGISYTFSNNGEQKTFEFTPKDVGSIPFTCWMGMISGEIKVVESVDQINAVKKSTTPIRSSGCGCGGCHI